MSWEAAQYGTSTSGIAVTYTGDDATVSDGLGGTDTLHYVDEIQGPSKTTALTAAAARPPCGSTA